MELNELGFITALGLDKVEDQVLVTSQIINPKVLGGEAATQDSPVTSFHETGRGIQEALRKTTLKSTRQLFVGQLQILVIGEELAKEGLGELIDHISRDHDYGKDFFIIIAKGTEAQKILQVPTPLEQIPASKLFVSLDVSSQAWGETSALSYGDLSEVLISNGKEAVVTGVTIEGSNRSDMETANQVRLSSPVLLKYSGLAVFKEDRLIGWLDERESIGYNFTQGNIKSTTFSFPCLNHKGYINVEVLGAKEKIEAQFKNDNPQMIVNLNIEAAVTNLGCNMDFSSSEIISNLQKDTEVTIKDDIEASIKKAQLTYQSDIFGFGDVIHRKNPTYWRKVEEDWDNYFSKLPVNIEVNVEMKHPFRNKRSFLERMKD
jgi:spore germination protein KC